MAHISAFVTSHHMVCTISYLHSLPYFHAITSVYNITEQNILPVLIQMWYLFSSLQILQCI